MRLLMPLAALTCVFGLTAVLGAGANDLRGAAHPGEDFSQRPDLAMILMLFGAFLVALAPGLMLANALLWAVPPVRRRLDRNAGQVSALSFARSVRGLAIGAMIVAPVGILLILAGVLPDWRS
jgi:hypothetical protein